MDFIEQLANKLERFYAKRKTISRTVVAYSGGIDSQVLLHACHVLARSRRIRGQLVAAHVHHGLSKHADEWAAHCEAFCVQHDIPYHQFNVSVDTTTQGVEAGARSARYRALANECDAHTCVLTAHHESDQAETMLLQLLRGNGAQALACTRLSRPLGEGVLFRPMLAMTRADIEHYAKAAQLTFVTDDSNAQTRFDRNYLRQTIMPTLQSRWPGATESLARSAGYVQEAMQVLSTYLQADLQTMLCTDQRQLRLSAWRARDKERRSLLLRTWLQQLSLPMPSSRQMIVLMDTFESLKQDARFEMRLSGVVLRVYRDRLYACPEEARVREQAFDANVILTDELMCRASIPLANVSGFLRTDRAMGSGLSPQHEYRIGFRSGGERICLNPALGRQQLKKCFQDWGVPPWLRDKVPLLFVEEELVAVVGYGIARAYAAGPEEYGMLVQFESTEDVTW